MSIGIHRIWFQRNKKTDPASRRGIIVLSIHLSSISTSLAITSQHGLSVPSESVYLATRTLPDTLTALPFSIWSRQVILSLSQAVQLNQVQSMTIPSVPWYDVSVQTENLATHVSPTGVIFDMPIIPCRSMRFKNSMALSVITVFDTVGLLESIEVWPLDIDFPSSLNEGNKSHFPISMEGLSGDVKLDSTLKCNALKRDSITLLP